jgi:hypothetical protein
LRNGLVHKVLITVSLIKIKPLVKIPVWPITETLYLLVIVVNIMPTILTQSIELLRILINRVKTLL